MENSHIKMKEQLEDLSIFALRELARRTGVNSPTSKKKDELIDEIIKINNGIKKPQTSKLGRPPKTYGYDMSNIFSYNFSNDNTLVLNQDDVVEEDLIRYRGVVEVLSNSVAFLWVFKDGKYFNFFIPNNLVEKYNLRSGDCCFVTIENKNGQSVAKDFLTVNSNPIAKYTGKRKDYYQIQHIQNKEPVEFKSEEFLKLNISKGENFYIYTKNFNKSSNFVVNLLNDSKNNCKIYLNVSMVEKSKHILNEIKNSEMFVCNLTDEYELSRRIVTLATERALRAFEDDENVLLVVDDVNSIQGVDYQDSLLLRKLMSVPKNGKQGSITIVAVVDGNKNLNQIERLADGKFYLE